MKLIQKSFLALTLISTISIGFLPFIAAAQSPPEATVTDLNDITAIAQKITSWARIMFFVLAGLFLVFAAFKFLTSGGDEDKIKGAKNALIYAIIAIVVALIATGVATFLKNVINTP